MPGRKELERRFLKGELLDHAVYEALARRESDRKLKALLQRLADDEKGHIAVWRSLLGETREEVRQPRLVGLRVVTCLAIRRVLGAAFVASMLERNEAEGLSAYRASLDSGEFGEKEMRYARAIIADEEGHEKALGESVKGYERVLDYMQSTILGLNDGLVEILAVIAGLATVATTSTVVVIVGLIAGISGTLSMAGGVYLSAKSERLMNQHDGRVEGGDSYAMPGTAALYTGIFYFAGALAAVVPFIFGLKGLPGIAASIMLVSIVLVAVSTIVAIASGTSIRRRSAEMLAISLGAAFATMLFGTLARIYFGVSI